MPPYNRDFGFEYNTNNTFGSYGAIYAGERLDFAGGDTTIGVKTNGGGDCSSLSIKDGVVISFVLGLWMYSMLLMFR